MVYQNNGRPEQKPPGSDRENPGTRSSPLGHDKDVRMPKAAFFIEGRDGKLDISAPRKRYETTFTGGNQSSVTAAGGLRPRQLALISEESQS